MRQALLVCITVWLVLGLFSCGSNAGLCDAGADAGCIGGTGGGTGSGGGAGSGGGSSLGSALHGTFDLTWTQAGQSWTVQGRGLTLPVHDRGIDETNYDAAGTVTIAPASFEQGGGTCTLTEPETRALNEDYFFKVRNLTAGPAQRWGFADSWRYQCVSAGGTWQTAVIVNFRTATGFGCATPFDVPAPAPPTMSGSFTMDCMGPAFTGTATWSFSP
jgi:hypothetical protein